MTPQYRYTLEPYVTPRSRHTCPECGQAKKFTRYIDNHTNEHLAWHVGKCDRLDNCGYHYTPRQYFAANPHLSQPSPKERALYKVSSANGRRDLEGVALRPSTIPRKVLDKTMKRYTKNYFVQYLYTHLDDETVHRLINNYWIGTSKRWPGATVFWQIDRNDKIRTGKIMLYNWETGKRVKEPYAHISWVHNLVGKTESPQVGKTNSPQANHLSDLRGLPDFRTPFNLKQCFFGEHLLEDNRQAMVCIVESEKTALIASAYMPQYCWLAAGSLEGLTYDKCRVLQGRQVLLWPDAGAAYTKWEERIIQLRARMGGGTTFNLARASANFSNGMDIADWLMGVRVK